MALTDMTDDTIRAMVEYAKDREAQIASLAETTGRSADEIRAIADGEPPEEEPAEPEAAEPEAKETPKLADVRAADPPEEKIEKPAPPAEVPPRGGKQRTRKAYDWSRLDPYVASELAAGKTVYEIATDLGMPDGTLYNRVKMYPDRFPHVEKPAKPSWPMPPKRGQRPEPKPETKAASVATAPWEAKPEPPKPETAAEPGAGDLAEQLRAILSAVSWTQVRVTILAGDTYIHMDQDR